jgi:hypothetical protein
MAAKGLKKIVMPRKLVGTKYTRLIYEHDGQNNLYLKSGDYFNLYVKLKQELISSIQSNLTSFKADSNILNSIIDQQFIIDSLSTTLPSLVIKDDMPGSIQAFINKIHLDAQHENENKNETDLRLCNQRAQRAIAYTSFIKYINSFLTNKSLNGNDLEQIKSEIIKNLPNQGSKDQFIEFYDEANSGFLIDMQIVYKSISNKLKLTETSNFEINTLIRDYNQSYASNLVSPNVNTTDTTTISFSGIDISQLLYELQNPRSTIRKYIFNRIAPAENYDLDLKKISATVTKSSLPANTFKSEKIGNITLNYIPYDKNNDATDFSKKEYYDQFPDQKIILTNGAPPKYDGGGGGTQGAIINLRIGLTDTSLTAKDPIYNNKYLPSAYKSNFTATSEHNENYGSVIFNERYGAMESKGGNIYKNNIIGIYHILGRQYDIDPDTQGERKNPDEFLEVGTVSAYYTAIMIDAIKNRACQIVHLTQVPGERFYGCGLTTYAFRRAVLQFCYLQNVLTREIEFNLNLPIDIADKEKETPLYISDHYNKKPWASDLPINDKQYKAIDIQNADRQLKEAPLVSKRQDIVNIVNAPIASTAAAPIAAPIASTAAATAAAPIAAPIASTAAASSTGLSTGTAAPIASPSKASVLNDTNSECIGNVIIHYIPFDSSDPETDIINDKYYKRYPNKKITFVCGANPDGAPDILGKKLMNYDKSVNNAGVPVLNIHYQNQINVFNDNPTTSILYATSDGQQPHVKGLYYICYNHEKLDVAKENTYASRMYMHYIAVLNDFAIFKNDSDILHISKIPRNGSHISQYIFRRALQQFCYTKKNTRPFIINADLPMIISNDEKTGDIYRWDVSLKKPWISDPQSKFNYTGTLSTMDTIFNIVTRADRLLRTIKLTINTSTYTVNKIIEPSKWPPILGPIIKTPSPAAVEKSSDKRLAEANDKLKEIEIIHKLIIKKFNESKVELKNENNPNNYAAIEAKFQNILDNYNDSSPDGYNNIIIAAQQAANAISDTSLTKVTANPAVPTIDSNLASISRIKNKDIPEKIKEINQTIAEIQEYIRKIQLNKQYLIKANATKTAFTDNINNIEQIRVDIKSNTFSYNNHDTEIQSCRTWKGDINALFTKIDEPYKEERKELQGLDANILKENKVKVNKIFYTYKVIEDLKTKIISYLDAEIIYITEHKSLFTALSASKSAQASASSNYASAQRDAQAAQRELDKLTQQIQTAQADVNSWDSKIQAEQTRADSSSAASTVPSIASVDASAAATGTTSVDASAAAAPGDASAAALTAPQASSPTALQALSTARAADASATAQNTTSQASSSTAPVDASAAAPDAAAALTGTPSQASSTAPVAVDPSAADAPAIPAAPATGGSWRKKKKGGGDKHVQDFKAANHAQIDAAQLALNDAKSTHQSYTNNQFKTAQDAEAEAKKQLDDADAKLSSDRQSFNGYTNTSREKQARDDTYADIPSKLLPDLIQEAIAANIPTTGGNFNNYSECDITTKPYSYKKKTNVHHSESTNWSWIGWVAFGIILCVVIYLLYLIFKPKPKTINIYNFRQPSTKSNNSMYFSAPPRPQYV